MNSTAASDPGTSLSYPARALLVAGLVALSMALFGGVARAQEVPETIAELQSADPGAVEETPYLIDYLAVTWTASEADIEAADAQSVIGDQLAAGERYGAVRFRHSGAWGEWIAFYEDGAQAPGEWGSALLNAERAEAYEIRGIPGWAIDPNVVVINTTDGAPVEGTGQLQGATGVQAPCLSRAEWGADESLRLHEDGTESWPATFYPVQGIVVHHGGSNDDEDPAAMVRAIYAFHTIGRGWGDIAYNYLIDDAGRVYEGRWSGTTSTPCSAGGDGSDFAHNDIGALTRGGHTKYHNAGNVGIALLGNYASPLENNDPNWVQAYPSDDMVNGLESLLASLVVRHGLDPSGEFGYVNPRCGAVDDPPYWDCDDPDVNYTPGKIRNVISGHRDWRLTACPGAATVSLLPEVRTAVGEKITSQVSGIVTDSWGFPIPGAVVSSDTGVLSTASELGKYVLGGVSFGDRRVIATASGFATAGKDVALGFEDEVVDLKLGSIIDRLWGANRYATSAAISAASFSPGVPVVYVAVGTGFADALSVAPVGGVDGGPVLLTRTDALPGVVAGELDRLDPGRIVVVGGTAVVSDAVMDALASYTSGSVSRLAGSDRYATSAAISAASFLPGVPVVYVAVGTGFADALSVAPVGGVDGGPVLLTKTGVLPAVVAGELDRLDPERIVVVGGPEAITNVVIQLVGRYLP